jgi:hypothetical protein
MAEIGSITGTVIRSLFNTPSIKADYVCHAEKVYMTWTFSKEDTGYIIYRNGKEIFNGTIEEFQNAGNMFLPTDHNTNLFSKSHSELMYIDTDIKKHKNYTYEVQAYKIIDERTSLSEKSIRYTVTTE